MDSTNISTAFSTYKISERNEITLTKSDTNKVSSNEPSNKVQVMMMRFE